MPRDINDYPVIVKTYALTRWTLERLATLPQTHRFTLGEKVQALLIDLLMQLTDAVYVQEKWHHLNAANRTLQKLRILFWLIGDLRMLPQENIDYARQEIDGIGGQVGGWMKSL